VTASPSPETLQLITVLNDKIEKLESKNETPQANNETLRNKIIEPNHNFKTKSKNGLNENQKEFINFILKYLE